MHLARGLPRVPRSHLYVAGGVAAAVHQSDGSAFGAISVCFPAQRYDPARVRAYGEIIVEAARSIDLFIAEQEDAGAL